MPKKIVCHRCGREIENGGFINEVLDAAGHTAKVCLDCGRRVHLRRCVVCGFFYDGTIETAHSHLCPHCVEQGYTRCGYCRRYVHPDSLSDNGVCDNCVDHGHTEPNTEEDPYMPEWQYHRTLAESEARRNAYGRCKNAVYLGFELETDGYNGSTEASRETARLVAKRGHCVCKGDGSLSCRGIELVSHPRTLLSHKAFDWRAKFQIILDHGGRSYEAHSSCGLHVHVNREFLSEDQWKAVDRFVNTNKENCQKFSQRRNSQWARFDSDMSNSMRDEAKQGWYRYAAVNFCNHRTIEFRLFKGTLNYPRFMATLEWVDALVRWVKTWEAPTDDKSWVAFCQYLAANSERYSTCIEYLKHREIWTIE